MIACRSICSHAAGGLSDQRVAPRADVTVGSAGTGGGLEGGSPMADGWTPPPSFATKGRTLTVPNLFLLLFAVGCAAAGQLLLKYGMRGVAEVVAREGGNLLLRAAASPSVWGGLTIFGISALAWLTVLSKVPLSVAYPFNAIGLLVIIGLSVVTLHEQVSPLSWLGVVMVSGGLVLVVVGQRL